MYLIVTKRMLEDGWISYNPEYIPNVCRHDYNVVCLRDDGTFVVLAPSLHSTRDESRDLTKSGKDSAR